MEITEGMKVGHEFIELNPDPGRRIRDPMFERVVGVNNDRGFAGYEGSAGNDRNDFIGVGNRFKRSFEDTANDRSLMPDPTFSQFSRGGETGNFGTGSGAAGRAVVCGARAEDKVLGVGIDAGLRWCEAFDVVDFSAIFAGDVLGMQGVTNGFGEIGESSDVLCFNFRTLVGDEEEPITTP
jgi:hypothetical protein